MGLMAWLRDVFYDNERSDHYIQYYNCPNCLNSFSVAIPKGTPWDVFIDENGVECSICGIMLERVKPNAKDKLP
jgi:transcription elongation factor Elf1